MYWSLPSSWEIHKLLFNLRTDFASVTNSRNELEMILSSNHDWGQVSWSKNCKSYETLDSSPYSCGLWKLLHIISVGANEANVNVLGDVKRVTPAYVAWVIRDFIAEFLPEDNNQVVDKPAQLKWCPQCRDVIMRTFDNGEFDNLCAEHISDSIDVAKKFSVDLSKWIWEIFRDTKSSANAMIANPSKINFEYDMMKKNYWPQEKIVRIAVLKQFSRKLPSSQRKHTRKNDQTLKQTELGST